MSQWINVGELELPTDAQVERLIEAQKGAAEGIAQLGVDGRVPDTELPARLGETALSATIEGQIIQALAGFTPPGGGASVEAFLSGVNLTVYGHSLAQVPNSYVAAGEQYAELLGSECGMVRTSWGINGSRMTEAAIGAIGNAIPGRGSTNRSYPAGKPGVVVVQSQLNDVASGTAAYVNGYKNSLRALLAAASASRRIEAETATKSGTWLAPLTAVEFSGGSVERAQNVTQSLTFEDVVTPGGHVYLLGLAFPGATQTKPLTIAVDGVDTGITLDGNAGMESFTAGATTFAYSPKVVRVPVAADGLPHDITVSVPAGSNQTWYVDALLVPAAVPPRLIVVKDPAPGPAASATMRNNWTANSAALNAAVDSVTAEFKGAVVVDANAGFDPATMHHTDGLHPNALGHRFIMGKVRDAIVRAVINAAVPSLRG